MSPEILDQRYELLETVREDTSGTVHLAKHLESGNQYFVRCLDSGLTADPAMVSRLQQELEGLQDLKHEQIGSTFEFQLDKENNRTFVVTECMEGEELGEFIRKQPQGRCPEATFNQLADQILSVLEYAHGEDYIHGNLTTGNIVVNPEGSIILTEFGVDATIDRCLREEFDLLTPASNPYASPERVAGTPPGATSDYYSIGCIFYEMLSGKAPFGESSADRRTPVELEPIAGVSTALNARLLQCLEMDPRKRPLSISEIRAGLSQLESTGGEEEPQENPEEDFPRHGWRRRALAVVVALIVGVILWQWYDSGPPTPIDTSEVSSQPAATVANQEQTPTTSPSGETADAPETRETTVSTPSRPLPTEPPSTPTPGVASQPPATASDQGQTPPTGESDVPEAVETTVSSPANLRGGSYTVQVGAFRSDASARRLLQRLQALGHSAEISTQQRDAESYHRVWVGRFTTRQEALASQSRLREAGFDTYVTTVR